MLYVSSLVPGSLASSDPRGADMFTPAGMATWRFQRQAVGVEGLYGGAGGGGETWGRDAVCGYQRSRRAHACVSRLPVSG